MTLGHIFDATSRSCATAHIIQFPAQESLSRVLPTHAGAVPANQTGWLLEYHYEDW